MSVVPLQPEVQAVVDKLHHTYARWGRDTPVAQMRSDWDALFAEAPVDAQVQPVDVAGRPGEWITTRGLTTMKPHGTLLYLHGGGFQLGSCASHRELMAALSQAAGCRVLGLDYRLMPEHRFPAPFEDTLAAWHWLRAQGLRPAELAVGGDSAGGGLALALLIALRDAGEPLPCAAIAMSPWTDMTCSGESYDTHAALDPLHQRKMLQAVARQALGPQGDARDPRASPLHAPLHGLPPLLLQAGERETVLSDSTEFAARAQAAGGTALCQVWPGMVHVFQQFPTELAQAHQARQQLGDFLRAQFALAPQEHQ